MQVEVHKTFSDRLRELRLFGSYAPLAMSTQHLENLRKAECLLVRGLDQEGIPL